MAVPFAAQATEVSAAAASDLHAPACLFLSLLLPWAFCTVHRTVAFLPLTSFPQSSSLMVSLKKVTDSKENPVVWPFFNGLRSWRVEAVVLTTSCLYKDLDSIPSTHMAAYNHL